MPGGPINVATEFRFSNPGLKVDLMEQPDSIDARASAATYLAWVLRTSRQHILRTQAEVYDRFSLRWAVHLGIPSAGFDDDPMRACFLAVLRTAWMLSTQVQPPTRDVAKEAVGQSDPPANPQVSFQVVPEIVAEVVGYAHSRERRNGLHVLVDVGASTTDICGFVLHEREGEDKWELLNAVVAPLGVLLLHVDRLDGLRKAECAVHQGVPPRDAGPLEVIPDKVSDYLESPRTALPQAVAQIDSDYRDSVVKALRPLIWDLRKNRDPHSPQWKGGLPVFVTGGGRGLGLVTTAALSQSATIDHATGVAPFRYPSLSSTRQEWGKDEPDVEMRERLGVGYGLSFPDIGSIRPPRRIGDVVPPPPKPMPPPPDYWGGKQ